MVFAFGEPKQKQCDRRDQPGGGGNRETGEIFPAVSNGFSFVIGRCRVETGQTQRATRQVNESNDPTRIRKFVEDDPINHQRRCEPEGNNVGERIEFATERAFVSAQTCQSSIQKIENESAEDEPDGGVKKIGGSIRVCTLQKRALLNLERGRETAEQVPRGH